MALLFRVHPRHQPAEAQTASSPTQGKDTPGPTEAGGRPMHCKLDSPKGTCQFSPVPGSPGWLSGPDFLLEAKVRQGRKRRHQAGSPAHRLSCSILRGAFFSTMQVTHPENPRQRLAHFFLNKEGRQRFCFSDSTQPKVSSPPFRLPLWLAQLCSRFVERPFPSESLKMTRWP